MSGLLAPLFLAGLAAAAAPWFIHRIRRPDREPLRFSSLMFIPQVRKEVIERRRIQHILLMLLRIAAVILLALAFARPYAEKPAAVSAQTDEIHRLILLDVSYSMGALDWFDQAKKAALKIVDQADPGTRVGVMAFGDTPALAAPIHRTDDEEAGLPSQARTAIANAQLTEQGTNYAAALQAAQDHLLQAEAASRLVIHLISDFQMAGMPHDNSAWKLSPRIEFLPVEIGAPPQGNVTLQDLNIRKDAQGQVRLRAKVKNWDSEQRTNARVRLILAGEEAAQTEVNIRPGHSIQAAFDLPQQSDSLYGWLQLDEDVLAADNRRYFAWNRPIPRTILVAAPTDAAGQWPAHWLIERALRARGETDWRVETVDAGAVAGRLDSDAPDLVVLRDDIGVVPQELVSYLERGGRALITAPAAGGESAGASVLESLGLQLGGPRREEVADNRFSMWSWVDLDHPVFAVFRAAAFNDFSALRFHNHALLTLPPDAEDVQIVARFEAGSLDEAPPAILDCAVGRGRALIWAFTIDLDQTNLPKSPKFVPLVHETADYLLGGARRQTEWTVGDAAPLDGPSASSPLRAPVDPSLAPPAAWNAEGALIQAGFLQIDDADSRRLQPVNIDPAESDARRIDPGEFEIRMCAAPDMARIAQVDPNAGSTDSAAGTEHREFGLWLIAAALGLLAAESLCAAWLTPKP